jgi:hypothetical protein
MSKNELQDLKSTIRILSSQIEILMKNKVINENEELKKFVGELAFNYAAFLDIQFLPKMKSLHPSFSEE